MSSFIVTYRVSAHAGTAVARDSNRARTGKGIGEVSVEVRACAMHPLDHSNPVVVECVSQSVGKQARTFDIFGELN